MANITVSDEEAARWRAIASSSGNPQIDLLREQLRALNGILEIMKDVRRELEVLRKMQL